MRRAIWLAALLLLTTCSARKPVPVVAMDPQAVERIVLGVDLDDDVLVCVQMDRGCPCLTLYEMRRQWRGILAADGGGR